MKYLSVAKPGIIFGNAITVMGGFFLASHGSIQWTYLLVVLIGMSLVIACGCVLNNYIDRDIDKLMERTKNRALVTGLISGRMAIGYAILLALLGFFILAIATNPLTLLIAFMGLFFYVVVYSLYFKRISTYGTLVGAISGSVPPMVGYCAVSNRLDAGAIVLFIILFLWQMPHFYAIAIYRLSDFKAALTPVLPLKRGLRHTKIVMIAYIAAFTLAAISPTLLGLIGRTYFFVALCLGLAWLGFAACGLFVKNDEKWARRVFLFSVINITLLSLFMAFPT